MPSRNSEGRNSLEENGFLLCPVDDFTVFTGFSCGTSEGAKDLNDFIQNDAWRHDRDMIARTYALWYKFEDGTLSEVPLAFASLLNDSIPFDDERKRKMPSGLRYDSYPAVKIGRLGVRVEVQKQGVGKSFLGLIKLLFLNQNRTGCRFITVDSYNEEKPRRLYLSSGFDFFNEDDQGEKTRLLYLDLLRYSKSRTKP